LLLCEGERRLAGQVPAHAGNHRRGRNAPTLETAGGRIGSKAARATGRADRRRRAILIAMRNPWAQLILEAAIIAAVGFGALYLVESQNWSPARVAMRGRRARARLARIAQARPLGCMPACGHCTCSSHIAGMSRIHRLTPH
jgi:hypothetical protein